MRGRYKTYQKHKKLERQSKRFISVQSEQDGDTAVVSGIIDIIDNFSDDEPIYNDIPRVYGRLPVTTYKSTLEPKEWIRKFCKPIFHWPKIEYISEIIESMIEAIRKLIPRLLLEPRNHGKTHTMVCLYLYALLELDYAVLIITSEASQKIRIFNAVLMV